MRSRLCRKEISLAVGPAVHLLQALIREDPLIYFGNNFMAITFTGLDGTATPFNGNIMAKAER
jgi:hypothetical protein